MAAAALTDKANEIRRHVESSGLQLIPSPYRFLHFNDLTNFLGTAVSAALLGLGAPFWFNALKSLTNLRPSLANKQGRQTAKQRPRGSDANSAKLKMHYAKYKDDRAVVTNFDRPECLLRQAL